MGRFWFGAGILVLFLILGLWVGVAMEDAHQDIARVLDEAAQQALAGDLEGGIALAQQAHSAWQSNWRRTASVADHAPMDEIDGLFAQTLSFGAAGRAEDFAAYCTRLAGLMTAMGEAHSLNWWNLL